MFIYINGLLLHIQKYPDISQEQAVFKTFHWTCDCLLLNMRLSFENECRQETGSEQRSVALTSHATRPPRLLPT